MFKNIHWAFEKIVKELNWMDNITKRRTLNKAKQMTTFIGFPDFINDPIQLYDYYSGVPISFIISLTCIYFLYYLNDYFEHLFSLKL